MFMFWVSERKRARAAVHVPVMLVAKFYERLIILIYFVLVLAAILLDSVVKISIVESMPVGHFNICRSCIEVPISAAIPHHIPLKVRLEDISIVNILGIVLVNLVRDIRNIDSSIGLSRDVQVMAFKLWEQVEPVENSIEVVNSRIVVIEGTLSVIASGVAYSPWAFNVEHV